MSADTTPTSVTCGTSRPLATSAVPTSTSSLTGRKRIDDACRLALALDDVAIEARHAQMREADPDLALDAFACHRPGSGCATDSHAGQRRATGAVAPQ